MTAGRALQTTQISFVVCVGLLEFKLSSILQNKSTPTVAEAAAHSLELQVDTDVNNS